jgi:orotidine-5'-phosphate decarboxylase
MIPLISVSTLSSARDAVGGEAVIRARAGRMPAVHTWAASLVQSSDGRPGGSARAVTRPESWPAREECCRVSQPLDALSSPTLSSTQESFVARVRRRWGEAETLLCVGLDGELERLPTAIRGEAQPGTAAAEEALVTFHSAIVEATADLVCAFKPNSAFYEAHGPAGLRALQRLIAHIHTAHPEVPVLLDAKRGDIGSTSQAYARAAFDLYAADGITLQPYLGAEALRPFLDRAEKGCFILCRTSNPGAGEFQDLYLAPSLSPTGGEVTPLYLHVARRVAREWNARGNCGLVVGATYPEELAAVRAAVGDLPILVPGIGAQGGDLAAVLRVGRDSAGYGLLISASRGILYASAGEDFAEAARREALSLRDAMRAGIQRETTEDADIHHEGHEGHEGLGKVLMSGDNMAD